MQSLVVEDIPQEGLELREEDTPSSFGLEDDRLISYAGAIAVSLMIEKIGDSVNVNGDISFKVRLICSRCLEPFSKEIRVPVDIVYQPEPLRLMKKESSLGEEDADTVYYGKDGIIKLGDAIREHIILSVPVKPLCLPDCLGLCPSCGKNLNQGFCSCQKQKLDSRFEKLKKIKL